MDTVRSWLDAGEVRRLAEGLLEPVNAMEKGGEDAEVSASLASVTSALAAARKVAEGSGMLQSPSEPDVGNGVEVESVSDSVTESTQVPDVQEFDPMQILELSEVLAAQFGLRAMVMMASGGEVIFDTLGNSRLTVMARKLANAMPSEGCLFVRVGAGTSLQVLPVSTGQGELTFGVIVSTALSSDEVGLLTEHISQNMV
jgi:hypothetical protein